MHDLAPMFRPVLARNHDTMLTIGMIDADALEQTLELFDSDEHMSYSPLLVSAEGAGEMWGHARRDRRSFRLGGLAVTAFADHDVVDRRRIGLIDRA